MRRKACLLSGLLLLVGIGAGSLTGCTTNESTAASSASAPRAAEPPKPRRNRLCSGDALGEKILRADPSLSSAGPVWNDRTTAGVTTR